MNFLQDPTAVYFFYVLVFFAGFFCGLKFSKDLIAGPGES